MQNHQAILDLLDEKERALNIEGILKGLSRPRDYYQALKKTLRCMVVGEQLARLDRGRYVVSWGALHGKSGLPPAPTADLHK